MEVPYMTMAQDKKATQEKSRKNRYSRRDFLAYGGAVVAGGALAVYAPRKAEAKDKEGYPLSQKYLICDSRNCAGCYSCMIACSLVHEGQVNFSLSRIQVHRQFLNNTHRIS
jgi:protein NrfC